jgi:hypothetical protein
MAIDPLLHLVHGRVERHALRGEHDGARRDPLLLAHQIGDGERRLIRADAPGDGVAHEELQHVAPGQQRKPGFVLQRPRRQLAGGLLVEPDVESFTSPMMSSSVRAFPRRRANDSSLPGIFTATGTKYSARFSWK